MSTAARRGILATVTAIVLVALGTGLGVVVGDALGIRTEESTQMPPADPVVPEVVAAVPPPRFTRLDVPDAERFTVALDALREAVATAPETSGEATLTVAVTGRGPDGAADDSYELAGSATALRITAGTEAGGVRGIYDLSAAVRAGAAVTDLIGRSPASALPMRMVDLGAVGVDPDPAQWESGTDYSHASRAFEDVVLSEAPYIDEAALGDAYDDWDTFLRETLTDGYNAVAWPGAVEFMTFSSVDGVYADDDPHVAQALALREAFGPFWDRAAQLGVKVFLRTDMPTLSPPLEDYLTGRFGSVDTEDPELWQVYTDGLDELYAAEPALSGVLVRIGEGGAIYETPGWDYYSTIGVRTVKAVRTMLEAYTDQAEASGREVVFRTWSVGIGDVGDMHTDAASYRAVLDGLDSPTLIVSTKYTLGDYYSWLPLNDTLETGDQRRIVEFQSRREFEAFGSFANDLGPELQWALQTLLAANPNIEGVWTWTQDGGPWRAGPMTLYLKAGFWHLYDLNTQVSAALARDPDTDVGRVTVDWAREWFSDDPATVTAVAEAMALSRTAVQQGLYLQDFAQVRAFALGLEPPPQMWLFEWDILTGDTATLDVLYAVIGEDRVDETIAAGEDALATARRMRELVEDTDPATWKDPALREAFVSTLAYETETLELLSSYREMFLRQAQWHDTGSSEVYAQWQQARDDYVAEAAAHLALHEGDVDHPAWNLAAAELGVERADRDLAMAWVARGLLVLGAVWVLIGIFGARTRLAGTPGFSAAAATWVAATRPWRARDATSGMSTWGRALLVVVPVTVLVATRAVQTSFLSWTHLALVFGAWAVFALAVRWLTGAQHSPLPVIAAVGGAIVLRCLVTLYALSGSGPGGYWFHFWTDPSRRVVYIAVAFALFVWVFVAAGWALSVQVGRRRATGVVLGAVGAGLAVPSLVVGMVGLEAALTAWNDQVGLLPWGLARILGITTYLEIPPATAWVALGLGLGTCAVGLALALPGRGRRSG